MPHWTTHSLLPAMYRLCVTHATITCVRYHTSETCCGLQSHSYYHAALSVRAWTIVTLYCMTHPVRRCRSYSESLTVSPGQSRQKCTASSQINTCHTAAVSVSLAVCRAQNNVNVQSGLADLQRSPAPLRSGDLHDRLNDRRIARTLRLSGKPLLGIPRSRTVIACHTFCAATPAV
jgi:hypothetical protein